MFNAFTLVLLSRRFPKLTMIDNNQKLHVSFQSVCEFSCEKNFNFNNKTTPPMI